MAGANSNIQVADLDFNFIKNNLKTFLQSQSTLKDYNFDGSALSVLLDVLAYNTQYNAYYLNMIANEMFLDTALQRTSVVSHAKLLDYTPQSAIAPTAIINLVVNGVNASSLTLPSFTQFLSGAIDGVNYTFVTDTSYTVNVVNNTATFTNVAIKEGTPSSINYTVNNVQNPTSTVALTDKGVDTTSLQVYVQQSSSNASTQIFSPASDFLTLTSSSPVYFIQESISIPETYEIYFGDGILGQQLANGSVVTVNYIVTNGTSASGANSFSIMNSVGGYSNTVVYPVTSATQGQDIESISSIKYQAPKSYSAQNRAVSKDDYITLIQQNNLGFSFDAVNVWGGQENNPPVYGQVFVCVKPTGSYTLTDTQKNLLIENTIAPISMMTVKPVIVDPDYTYVKINSNVVYDASKTILTSSQIQNVVVAAIQNFASSTLNTFNSTFSSSDMVIAVQGADPSIVTNEFTIQLQKKFYPNLSQSENYKFYFNVGLNKGILTSGISSYPGMQFRDPSNPTNIIDGVYIEEVPSETIGIASISLMNPGFSYQSVPTITIVGDGTGATATATLEPNGTISAITVTNSGQNYTQAVVVITPASNDTTGQGASAVAILQGQYGTLRTYYYNSNNVKTIFNSNIGTVDYTNGIVSLNSFAPYDIDNPLGQLAISVNPTSTIVSSAYNRIVTVDSFDASAITVNVTSKN